MSAPDRVRELDGNGEHRQAVLLAIDEKDENSPATAFNRVDSELAASIDSARRNFVENTSAGANALTLLAPAYALLSVIAALGATLGIRERLREYR